MLEYLKLKNAMQTNNMYIYFINYIYIEAFLL